MGQRLERDTAERGLKERAPGIEIESGRGADRRGHHRSVERDIEQLALRRECSPDLLMSREQDSCSRARRLNHDPSLGPSVVGERRRVFHQFELQNIDEETNRSVIVVNDESDEFQLRHLHVS